MDRIWFKRKIYGWGWYPATWQGWVITLLYVVLALALGFTVDESASPRDVAFTALLPLLILTTLFITVVYKTGETPRWQWGNPKNGEK